MSAFFARNGHSNEEQERRDLAAFGRLFAHSILLLVADLHWSVPICKSQGYLHPQLFPFFAGTRDAASGPGLLSGPVPRLHAQYKLPHHFHHSERELEGSLSQII